MHSYFLIEYELPNVIHDDGQTNLHGIDVTHYIFVHVSIIGIGRY
jgi:hypothetical protein